MRECQAPDCSRPAARKWCSEECRKRTKYGGTCERCGVTTNGSAGPGKAAKLCHHCQPTTRKQWTEDTIIEAMVRWAADHGRQPGAREWQKAERGVHPSTSTVLNAFDSWNDAIQAVAHPVVKSPMFEGLVGDDDYSTNTPAENRARVAKAQAAKR